MITSPLTLDKKKRLLVAFDPFEKLKLFKNIYSFQDFFHDRIPGLPGNTHPEPLSVDSVCSHCGSESGASDRQGSGSGFRIRKKRKQPTRLITVREMNTVWRSLSETRNMSHMLKLEHDSKNTFEIFKITASFYLLYDRVHARRGICRGSQRISCRETRYADKPKTHFSIKLLAKRLT